MGVWVGGHGTKTLHNKILLVNFGHFMKKKKIRFKPKLVYFASTLMLTLAWILLEIYRNKKNVEFIYILHTVVCNK